MKTPLRQICLFIFVSSYLSYTSLGQTQKLDSIIASSTLNNQFSGSILIAKNGIIIYEKVAGFADSEKKRLNNDKTSFSIASVGKIFTATLIMKFVELGQLKLDEPVKTYLPDINFPNNDKITIHHLLSHTSGLNNYMTHPRYQELLGKNIQIDDIVKLIAEQPLVFNEPGLKHVYSNSGYIILGKILENITRKRYDDLLDQMILKPLSMVSTKLLVSRDNANGYAIGYRKMSPQGEWESTINTFPVPLSDGGIFTTSKDLLAFDQALFTGKIFSNKTLGLMTQTQAEGEQPGFGKIAYGYGLMLSEFNGQSKSVGHNGGSPGYNAEYRHYTFTDGISYTVIILSNHERVIRPLFFTIQDMILNNKI